MKRYKFVFPTFVSLFLALFVNFSAQAQNPTAFSRYEEEKRDANANTVSIISSAAAAAYTRFSEDIMNVLDEKEQGGLRVLPMLGRGGGQNFLDLLFLRGVDMGLMEQDIISYFKRKDPILFGKSDRSLQYIAKISNSEYHIFVRKDIKKLEDLRGKVVSFYKPNSSSAIASETVFNTCGIEVDGQFMDPHLAEQRFKKGEIAGVARISGAPHAAFNPYKAEHGHFLPITASTLPAGCYEKLLQIYLPAFLKPEHYPDIIAKGEMVPTVANSTILAVYAWPETTDRYKKLAGFVKKFFDKIDEFRTGPRHPKWKEINLAAEVPGWTRFKPAQEWLDEMRKQEEANEKKPEANDRELKTAFNSFLEEYSKASGSRELTPAQRELLFGQFVKWWQTQKTLQATR